MGVLRSILVGDECDKDAAGTLVLEKGFDLPARGDRREWPWRGESAGRDGRVSGLRCSCAAGDTVDGLMMIDCSSESKIKNHKS